MLVVRSNFGVFISSTPPNLSQPHRSPLCGLPFEPPRSGRASLPRTRIASLRHAPKASSPWPSTLCSITILPPPSHRPYTLSSHGCGVAGPPIFSLFPPFISLSVGLWPLCARRPWSFLNRCPQPFYIQDDVKVSIDTGLLSSY